MKNQPIGVFDSGLGGLTAVKELQILMPEEDIIYFGDTGRVPYGTRGRDTIRKYAAQDMNFLLRHGVKMVISACGTISSTSADIGAALPVPFLGIVEPAATAAAAATANGRIGVLGTNATVNSNAFYNHLKSLLPSCSVTQQACPLFVNLVEGGFVAKSDPVLQLVARRYLEPMIHDEVDTLILGCTHFPIIAPVIRSIMGPRVTLINSGAESAHMAMQVLEERGLRTDRKTPGTTSYYVTDEVQGFARIGSQFLGKELTGSVTKVDMDSL